MARKSNYRRKKDPENVRKALLEAAAQIATASGLGGITLSAVTREAGVTKGALFHHFDNKEALLEEMFLRMLEELDTAIDACMAKDEVAYGRFTRAYVEVALKMQPECKTAPDLCSDPSTSRRWSEWLNARVLQHAETDDFVQLEVVRRAVDGAWYELQIARTARFDRQELKNQLLRLAQPPS